MGVIAKVIGELEKNYKLAKGELEGKAVSRAVRIKPLAEIAKITNTGKPTATTARIRMPDGTPMTYWTDGSLRHSTGFKPGKAARKALKRARRSK